MTDSTGSLSNTKAVIGEDGSVRLSNISSGGIDFDSITKALVAAKRSPAVTMETNIKENNSITADFQSLNSTTKILGNTLDSLRGSTSSFTKDVFDQRSGTVQTYASDDALDGHISSVSSNIANISVEEGAAKGSHTLEVLQKASAHQFRSDSVSDKFTDISALVPPLPTGSFTVNGTTIDVTASDSLYEIAEKLNNADAGITATIVSASPTENYLVIASDKTGTDNSVKFGLVAGSESESLDVLNGLGLTTGTSSADLAIKNQTTAPKNAKIDIDGLGVVIERQSNTIDDVLDGISIDIIKAEPNTIIEVTIESDLAAVKQGILDFVDAYNNVRDLINEQQESKPRALDENGDVDTSADSEFGNLAFDATFRQFAQSFTSTASFSNFSLDDGYRSLSQIGITIDSDGKLQVDNTTLDKRLIENVGEVKKLFSFNLSSNDANISYISNTTNTAANTDSSGNTIPYYLSIQGTDADGKITGASLRTGPGENDYLDGSVTINGNVLTFTDSTGAEGLKIIYNGGINMGEVNDIEITPTRGIADSFYYTQKDYTNAGTGQFDKKVLTIEETNSDLKSNIINIDERVDRYEKMIKAKFLATEQAMARSDALLEQLKNQFDAMNNSNN
jgi:flagellar hook-associated protein 2